LGWEFRIVDKGNVLDANTEDIQQIEMVVRDLAMA